jgi:hypothetical protein
MHAQDAGFEVDVGPVGAERCLWSGAVPTARITSGPYGPNSSATVFTSTQVSNGVNSVRACPGF